ncbi:glutamate decarboxylase [Raineyella sp. W15-4]|uniref:glutamate decarboxylase n=1 Tax=Raineyella sp. W15-4 TaxID=3081651 RepID=UPI0029534075|nr:glutamate decarboxylase [Raineyella sp. W15-4]WOQ18726.1 glutamate decarboxylase [Raineyella sp. W15-4]
MAVHRTDIDVERLVTRPLFALPNELDGIPKDQLPTDGMDPRVAYRLLHDELMLDGNSRQNLATFVTTFMDDEADRLFGETLDKNMIDKDEYPQTAAIEGRCVKIVSELWNSPSHEAATGTSTTGSSEAVMLAGLAMKWLWRQRRTAAGLPHDRPNLVMGINVQVVWEKFCRYWDVEPRYAPIEPGRLHLDAAHALPLVDDNTIGVVAILGSTFDGSYEPVKEIATALDDLAAGGGPDVPVHVDAASGGFVAPFLDPELEWDFRVPRVRSINASGHKYGLVYPGVGWVIWRTPEQLPEDLVFHVNYLGGDMPTFGLNFSRPGAQVIAQYYNFIRLGREGYRAVQQACRDTATHLAREIAAMGPYELLSDGSELPVFFFRLRPEVVNYTVYDVSAKLRERGWQVPAYSLPADLTDVSGLRIVVRNGFGHDLADLLLDDLRRATDYLEHLPTKLPADPSHTESFRH